MPRNFRALVVSILALWHRRRHKEIAAVAGMPEKRVSLLLRGKEIDDDDYPRLLAAASDHPAEAAVVNACLDSLAALSADDGLSAAEKTEVEEGVRQAGVLHRRILTATVQRSRAAPILDRYPKLADREPARWLAGLQYPLLRDLSGEMQWAFMHIDREYQSWACVEKLCAESEVEAGRDLDLAARLARLARQTARRVRGPQAWVRRVRGLAVGHDANILRVQGRLTASAALFRRANRLWSAGADPDGVLDPGRLFDLEASLCRDQRRFEEALALLERARRVSRSPGRVMIKKGFTLEVMGEYDRAIEALLEAKALPEVQSDPRLSNILYNNLALNYSHVGRFAEAAALAREVRAVASKMGDAILLLRVTWIDGRVAAGLGRTREALGLLAKARWGFNDRGMMYDVALALLEEAALLLDEGRTAEVKALAFSLRTVFEAEEVHREAQAALALFYEAATQEAATAELTRRVLRYLFRARYDQGLPFSLC